MSAQGETLSYPRFGHRLAWLPPRSGTRLISSKINTICKFYHALAWLWTIARLQWQWYPKPSGYKSIHLMGYSVRTSQARCIKFKCNHQQSLTTHLTPIENGNTRPPSHQKTSWNDLGSKCGLTPCLPGTCLPTTKDTFCLAPCEGFQLESHEDESHEDG